MIKFRNGFTLNGDGKLDLITYDGSVLAWFDTSKNMFKIVIIDNRDDHGGITPMGVYPDIVIPGIWLENPGDGYGKWNIHKWPHKPVINASYGTSMRSWIADINKDGEIVSKVWNADGPNYHVDYWRNDINNP